MKAPCAAPYMAEVCASGAFQQPETLMSRPANNNPCDDLVRIHLAVDIRPSRSIVCLTTGFSMLLVVRRISVEKERVCIKGELAPLSTAVKSRLLV
jgi:hypothetical protein